MRRLLLGVLVVLAGGTCSTADNKLTIGDLEFYVMKLPGPGTDGLLGCNFFARHQVSIDFVSRTVAFRATDPPDPHPCPSPLGP